jgi:hypothetical protein
MPMPGTPFIKRWSYAEAAVGFAFMVLVACASPEAARMVPVAPGATVPTQPGPLPEVNLCPPDNPFCTGQPVTPVVTGTVPTQTTCGDVPFDLTPGGVNIMLAVDSSAPMASHWAEIQTAIRSLRTNHPTAAFGLQVFWGDAPEDLTAGANTTNNICNMVHSKVLEVGDHSEQELIAFLGDAPQGSTAAGSIAISPVIEPINYYLTNPTKLADPTRTNYLVLISNGNDNCFGSYFTTKADKLLAYQKLGVELSKLNIRTIPIGFQTASTPAADPNDIFAAFGAVAPATGTDFEALGTLLKYGGSKLTEVPTIDNPGELAKVVSLVGQSVRNCRFEVPANLDPTAAVNPFELSFTVNGKLIARDRHQLNGWDFVNGSTTQVELFGQGCEAIQSGLPLKVGRACAEDVCGTAAVKVETKPRAVLLLLDSSASRIECADGSINCLTPPGDPMRPPSFWEVVQHAIGASLTAGINDDVDFGMQFLPSKVSETLSCEVAAQPEIPVATGTEISIMRAMLEKLPFGLSPVVQVIENVAAAPGRLADPSILGAVVLLSDGGDNCSGDAEGAIVSRLGAAAKKLFDAGVKTYAVRYGSDAGRTPEGEEQLTALVTNGGTAVTDPADPSRKAYLDAKNESELAAALATIADRLATCSFTLGGLSPTAEKERANLFLNGEAIPFDQAAKKQNGWNWVDPERTTVELYGESCTAFKTNRRTSVVLEFGCPPVNLQ